jgi:catechol 2,3-dioxygenase-like lactoylglutathione lyase family enzyme
MEISVGVLDHYSVSTRKLKETVQFYEDVLGFVNGPRPQFNFPGAWLYSAGHPVLHLNDISQTDKQQPPDSGVIDHVAFGSRGFEAMKEHLTSKGVQLRVRERGKSRAFNERGATCIEIQVLPDEFGAFCMSMKKPDFSIASLDRCARAKAPARGTGSSLSGC